MIPSFNNARTALLLALALSCVIPAKHVLALPSLRELASPRPAAQSYPAASAPQAKLKIHVAVVKVDASIVDKRGRFVEGLRKENFRIFDDGHEQLITFFASTEAPAQVLVLVEMSPAVFLIHRQHLEAAYSLLSGLASDDRVALVAYSGRAQLVLPFTTDKADLARALVGLQYTLGSGDLNFYDSVSASLDWISSISGKKSIVVLSTGLDSSPEEHWRELLEKLRGSEVTIFPVALGGFLRSFRGSAPAPSDATATVPPGLSFKAANHALETLAYLSGGQAFFPKQDKDFTAIYQRIAQALRHEYTLGFAPPAADGRFHALRLEIFDSKGRPLATSGTKERYRIFTRQSYLAPSP